MHSTNNAPQQDTTAQSPLENAQGQRHPYETPRLEHLGIAATQGNISPGDDGSGTDTLS